MESVRMSDEELEEEEEKKKLTAEELYSTWNVPFRQTVLFVVGLFFTYNELVNVPDSRPTVLMFLAGLLGIPFASQADRLRNLKKNGANKEQEE
jgi:hypothetical protein